MTESMLKTSELINHLKNKNITFNNIDEKDAEHYLKYNNNYFNLYSYILIIKILKDII